MKSNFDCVIVGCGIAGMTAAIYLKRANVNFCIIDYDAPGGTLNKVKTISNYPGFKEISGPELAFRVFEQISSLDILIKYGKVLKIEDNIITTDKEEIKAKKIIIATGRPPKHIKLLEDLDNVSEEKLAKIIRKELEIFLLELGHGYAYIGKEVRMGESYCDLLFFNTEFLCYVVIELKTRKIKKMARLFNK